jgi:hypothetical protein
LFKFCHDFATTLPKWSGILWLFSQIHSHTLDLHFSFVCFEIPILLYIYTIFLLISN